MAKLRSELESLQEKIVNNQEEEVQKLAGLVNSCVEKCNLSFNKVGKQVRDYEQIVRLLKEEKDTLSKECQRLNNIIEGEYSVWNIMHSKVIVLGQPSAKINIDVLMNLMNKSIDRNQDFTLDNLIRISFGVRKFLGLCASPFSPLIPPYTHAHTCMLNNETWAG